MTVRNEQEFICDVIGDLQDQTIPPEKILILDDGPTDLTGEILDTSDSVTVWHREDSGRSETMEIMANRDKMMCDGRHGLCVTNFDADLHVNADHMECMTSRMIRDDVKVANGAYRAEPRRLSPESGLVIDVK